MSKIEKNSYRKKVEFRIAEIKKVSYFQNDYSEFGLLKADLKEIGVNLSTKFIFSENENIISIYIKTNFFVNKENKQFELFGIETAHKFEIKDLQKRFFNSVNKKFDIPDNIMLIFINISVSGTRGMLAALCSNPAYSKIILPIINPIDLLNSYKGQNKDAL